MAGSPGYSNDGYADSLLKIITREHDSDFIAFLGGSVLPQASTTRISVCRELAGCKAALRVADWYPNTCGVQDDLGRGETGLWSDGC